ncbi:MAG: SUMF1/EgtB/PvdO family nonheme iron enzyme [Prevotellaceae bacterium]|jgi:TPR repeat protein|nr:SUMF1/EgtB/PvdO family nonheme iron enzyme [Prevotellaceae bacterium]
MKKKVLMILTVLFVSTMNSYGQAKEDIDPLNFDMVLVNGGNVTYSAGKDPDSDHDEEWIDRENATVKDFYIGRYEVTQAQWKAVMKNNPSLQKGDSLPVENTGWDAAQEFIKRLNVLTGKNYRLPTSAEWEYAAIGGEKSKGYEYSGGNNTDDVSWHEGNSDRVTHPVGEKQPNELGIYDMTGNVWEFCDDLWGEWILGTEGGLGSVYRGGSCYTEIKPVQNSMKYIPMPDYPGVYVGLRLACSMNNEYVYHFEDEIDYYNIGNEYRENEDYKYGIAAYQIAVKLKPDYAAAYYNLGICYKAQGDLPDAIEAYKKAIDIPRSKIKVDHLACLNLGNIYTEQKKYKDAISAYQNAINRQSDFALAYRAMGSAYTYLENYLEATNCYKKAAQLGDRECQKILQDNNISWDVSENSGDIRKKRDDETDKQYVERITVMAEQGDPICQNLFAFIYMQSGNYGEAAKWYRKAAEQGDATAQCDLGTLYQEGRGVSKDYDEALKWYHKSAAQGFATAQYEIGNMYHFGQGVLTDHVEAIKWYYKAAEQGLKEAQYNLGCQFAKGEGISKDMSKAISFWEKAAEQGYLMAQCILGIVYYSGDEIKQDYAKAKYWLQKALASDDPKLYQIKSTLEKMLNELKNK